MKKRKYPPKVSKMRQEQLATYAKVKRTFLEQNRFCVRCNEFIEPKYRTLHHWAGRVHTLLCWVPGFRCACMRCHNWIETHRNDAVRLGFRAPDNMFNRPSLVIPR